MNLKQLSFLLFSGGIDTTVFWRFVRFAAGIAWHIQKRSPKWAVLLGYASEMLGNTDSAADSYQRGVNTAVKSETMSALRWRHPAQFFLERIYHRIGSPCEKDPLFSCFVKNSEPAELKKAAYSGCFKVEFTFSGLMIIGMVPGGTGKTVEVFINGELLREFRIGDGFPYPGFNITILRSTLGHFPQKADLTLRTKGESFLSLFGRHNRGKACEIFIPYGSGGIMESANTGLKLDKKGNIVLSRKEIEKQKIDYMKLYDTARDFFENKLDRSLILMYGTLLGCFRQDNLIDGDDDFDVGYISEKGDPVSVKEETKDLIRILAEAGFTVSFNRRGRLFRLHGFAGSDNNKDTGLHLDIRPVWFQDGKVWAHNHFCMPAGFEDFLPAETRTLLDTKVYIPSQTEKFLFFQYGPGWKVPDPGFVYHRSEINKDVLINLEQALITPREYLDLAASIDEKRTSNPSIGKLISIGAENFYPLTGLEEDLD